MIAALVSTQTALSFTAQSQLNKPSFLTTTRKTTQLHNVITGTKDEDLIDEGRGGVRLAKESVLKVSGSNRDTQKGKDGDGMPEADAFTRYTQLTSVDESALSKTSNTVVCRGTGNELYQDPGESLEKVVIYAPSDAVRDALNSVDQSAIKDAKKLVLNFCGGDGLKPMEVMDGVEKMVSELNIDATQMKIDFNSLSHNTFPMEVCTVTVVAVNEEFVKADGKDRSPLEASVVNGEMYFHSGKWWTVVESDINTSNE